jgi:hypothetical protein
MAVLVRETLRKALVLVQEHQERLQVMVEVHQETPADRVL